MAEAAAEGRGAEAGALVAAEPDTEGAAAAGGAADVDADDDAGVCAALFRGLVFFLGREVPREALLLVIRSFGGTVGWQGEGSPIEESDESITHQVRRIRHFAFHRLGVICASMPEGSVCAAVIWAGSTLTKLSNMPLCPVVLPSMLALACQCYRPRMPAAILLAGCLHRMAYCLPGGCSCS